MKQKVASVHFPSITSSLGLYETFVCDQSDGSDPLFSHRLSGPPQSLNFVVKLPRQKKQKAAALSLQEDHHN